MSAADGRETILSRLRDAARNPLLAADRAQPPAVPGRERPDPRGVVDRWRQELQALTGTVYGPVPEGEALGRIVSIAEDRHVTRLIAWDPEAMAIPDLGARLAERGITLELPRAGALDDPDERRRLAALPMGLSGAVAGLADTGSIVVASGRGRPRSASLLAPVLIAVLRVADLYPDLPSFMQHAGARLVEECANVVIITGPSRTADIELVLVVGVHGPGEIHVVLIE